MSKKNIVNALLANTNLRVRDADELAGILIDKMREDIVGGGLKLPGIGSFVVVKRAKRQGTNPRTKSPYTTPERKAVRFKPSAALTKMLNTTAGK